MVNAGAEIHRDGQWGGASVLEVAYVPRGGLLRDEVDGGGHRNADLGAVVELLVARGGALLDLARHGVANAAADAVADNQRINVIVDKVEVAEDADGPRGDLHRDLHGVHQRRAVAGVHVKGHVLGLGEVEVENVRHLVPILNDDIDAVVGVVKDNVGIVGEHAALASGVSGHDR